MIRFYLALSTVALLLATTAAVGQTDTPFDVRAAMQNHVNPSVTAIWDVTNNAMNDDGGLDPAQMDAANWAAVIEGAERLRASGRAMADASSYIAAAPSNTGVDEGQVPMEAVQRLLDADPRLFAQMGEGLAGHADQLAAAARSRDVAATEQLVAELDGVCASCHSRFWSPE